MLVLAPLEQKQITEATAGAAAELETLAHVENFPLAADFDSETVRQRRRDG